MRFSIVILFFILSVHANTVESNSKNDLIGNLCGSWIIAENSYRDSIYLFDTITKYHQVNITRDDASDSLLVVEVHVMTGKMIRGLFTIVVEEQSSSYLIIHVESLEDHSIQTFKLHNLEEGMNFGVYQSEQFTFSVILTKENQIQIVRKPLARGLLTRFTGKKIKEKHTKTTFERFGGIGVSILAVLLLVSILFFVNFIGFPTVLH